MAQEGKKETRQITPFFHLLFELWLFVIFIFVFEKCQNSFSWPSPPFGPFWSVKYLNFGSESYEISILSRSIQETYTLRKVKNQVLLFQSTWEPNLSDLMVYNKAFKELMFNVCSRDAFKIIKSSNLLRLIILCWMKLELGLSLWSGVFFREYFFLEPDEIYYARDGHF